MERIFEIEFYSSPQGSHPVREFFKSLSKHDRFRVGEALSQLEIFGPALRMPLARPLVGEKGLFELRIVGQDKIYRVFYFYHTKQTFVLLHAFVKKSQKTPKKEIEIAKKRKIDYLNK